MAVQAQYFSSFNNMEEEFLLQQHALLLSRYYNSNYGEDNSLNGICNNNNIMALGGSRKRYRDDCSDHQQFWFPNKFMKAHDKNENGSQLTSTSGRPFENDLSSHIYQQNQEMESLILLENQKLESGLKEVHKKQRKTLLSVIEQQVLQKMQDKDKELTLARILNAELEEKLLQLNAENQIWFNVAKKNESMVSLLKSSLEQIMLLQKEGQQVNEGFGNSSGSSVVDDAESCCDEDASEINKSRTKCKGCQENEVSMLLLPCRHVCLCKNCDSSFDTCPVCYSFKKESLEIFMT